MNPLGFLCRHPCPILRSPSLGTTVDESHATLGSRVGGALRPGSGQSSLANALVAWRCGRPIADGRLGSVSAESGDSRPVARASRNAACRHRVGRD